MWLTDWIKKVARNIIGVKSIEQAMGVTIATSEAMRQNFELWRNMWFGNAPWNSEKVPSRRTAAQIAGEYGRVTTVEHESEVTGGPRAEWLNEQYQTFVEQLQNVVSMLAAGGELIWKPWPNNKNGITVTVYENNQYEPVRYNTDGELLRFITQRNEVKIRGERRIYYTLLEDNDYNEANRTFTIRYEVFRSDTPNTLGVPATLAEVEEWAHLEYIDKHGNIRHDYPFVGVSPWFVHIKMPMQNDVEQSNRNGVSIYSKAVEKIREYDEQGEWIRHEFEAGRLKQNASLDLFRKDEYGNPIMDSDVYQVFDAKNLDGNDNFIATYSPTLRIDSSTAREQRLLREIEFQCQMSYGILSDPQTQALTATEIEASRERFGSAIRSIQGITEDALRQLVSIFDEMATAYTDWSIPAGEYDMSFWWDDSVIESQKEKDERVNMAFAQLLQMKSAGLIKDQVITAFMVENSDYLSKLTEEQMTAALEWMPANSGEDMSMED